jgi:hypothetical protein
MVIMEVKYVRRFFLLLLLLLSLSVLTACAAEPGSSRPGEALNYMEKTYPLIDVVKSSAEEQDVSRVFRAEGSSIEEVATQIQSEVTDEPIEITDNTGEKQVIVYENYFVTLTSDPENPKDTLVEVAPYGFVRDNYDPDFFDGLMTYWFLSQLFDVNDWRAKQRDRCYYAPAGCYGSYGSTRGGYKGPIGQPSLRGGSVRGGGPGTGK